MLKKFSVALFLIFSSFIFAQQNVKDSVLRIPITGLHFSVQMPAGDLSQRFGPNLNVGMPLYFKTKKNFLLGGEGNYLFGSSVKEDVLAGMKTPDGTITNSQGNIADVRVYERGWNLYLSVGKLFPVLSSNKNSGLIAMIGFGYMQHKIKLYDGGKNLTQIYGDLKKGYDRLTGGPACHQFIGYMYLSNNRLANFYIGFEAFEGFTNGLRGYQYDLMQSDNRKHVDILYGLRLGWLLPIYRRVPKDFYYF